MEIDSLRVISDQIQIRLTGPLTSHVVEMDAKATETKGTETKGEMFKIKVFSVPIESQFRFVFTNWLFCS